MATPTIVYDFSELREDVHAVETDVEAIQTQISDMQELFSKQHTELVGYEIQQVDRHNDNVVIGVLHCGLLGLLIGISFVNIFKSR